MLSEFSSGVAAIAAAASRYTGVTARVDVARIARCLGNAHVLWTRDCAVLLVQRYARCDSRPHFHFGCITRGAYASYVVVGPPDDDKATTRRDGVMASQWGSNSIAPGSTAGWYFVRNKESGFLPVLQVMPLSPSFANNDWELTGGGYPYFNQLGISTIWSQLSDDETELVYYMAVQNNSNNTIEYAFLENDL